MKLKMQARVREMVRLARYADWTPGRRVVLEQLFPKGRRFSMDEQFKLDVPELMTRAVREHFGEAGVEYFQRWRRTQPLWLTTLTNERLSVIQRSRVGKGRPRRVRRTGIAVGGRLR